MNACGESKHTTCQQPQFALCLGIWCNKSIPIVEKKEIWGRRPAVCREMFLQALGVEEIRVGYRRTLAAGDNAECIHQQSETQTWINASNAKTVWSTMQLFISSSSVEWNSKFWIRGWQVYPRHVELRFYFLFFNIRSFFFFFSQQKRAGSIMVFKSLRKCMCHYVHWAFLSFSREVLFLSQCQLARGIKQYWNSCLEKPL